jgi:tetratricopeptide (TPR) repeat protein
VDLLVRERPYRLELMIDLGEAHMQAGSFDAAANVLDEAMVVAGEIGEERFVVRANLIRVAVDQFRSGGHGSANRALDAAQRAISVLEPMGDDGGLARAWRLLMITQSNQGHVEEAARAAERVIEHAGRADDPRIAARSAGMIAYLMLHGATPALEALRRCDELLEGVSGDRSSQALIQSTMAILTAMRGETEAARNLYQQSYSVLTELGAGLSAMTSSIDSSQVERLAGDFETAERDLRRDYDALAAIDESYFRSTVAAFLSQVLLAAGDTDEAMRFTEIAETLGEDDDVLTQVPWRGVRARILASRGDATEARRLATEAVDLAGTSDPRLRADALIDLADVLQLVGDQRSSGPPVREALNLYELKGDLVSADRLRWRVDDVGLGVGADDSIA